MTRIAYFPIVQTQAELLDTLSRAAWFFSASPIEGIDVLIAGPELARLDWRVAPGMDPSIAARLKALRPFVRFTVATSKGDVEPIIRGASIVLFWRKDEWPSFLDNEDITGWIGAKRTWQVDPAKVRMEGSFYIEAALHLVPDKEECIRHNRDQFIELADRLGCFERAYLLATGPSVAEYHKFNYDDALGIVCNSVILDEKIMECVRPKILVFADPIFHFGPSQYAASFRNQLLDSAARHEYVICMPFKYYDLFVSHVPELEARTIGIPFRQDIEHNLDLATNFILRTTANILTFVMIPLAGTFAREICFLGCDGRRLSADKYFWDHNPQTQINDKMANIRAIHPAFFDIDYNDYYLEHCSTLESFLTAGENLGKRFISLAPSHIPALKSRSMERVAATTPRALDIQNVPSFQRPSRVLIIDPDALTDHGHYLAYNDHLEKALSRLGVDADVLCSVDIDPDLMKTRANYYPRLSIHSWSIGPALKNDFYVAQFQQEFREFLDGYLEQHDTEPITIYMYCGSLDFAKIFCAAVGPLGRVSIHVNLFWLYYPEVTSPGYTSRWKDFMDSARQLSPLLTLTAPTATIQSSIKTAFDVTLDVAPHPSVTVDDAYYYRLRKQQLALQPVSDRRTVLFPAVSRPEKGFASTLDAVRLLNEGVYRNRYHCVLRRSFRSSELEELAEIPDDVCQTATLLEGQLSWKEFDQMFRNADIAILPYGRKTFSNRTSGLLIDATYYGVPCVVVKGTWLAEFVTRYGCGVVIDECDDRSVVSAVEEISRNLERYRKKTREAAAYYFQSNSWLELARTILRDDTAKEIPRVLVLDYTRIASPSATGQLKQLFFREWPSDKYRQVYYDGHAQRLHFCGPDGCDLLDGRGFSSVAEVLAEISEFQPQVVYYRPVADADLLHAVALEAKTYLGLPWVMHLMDDWLTRLRLNEPERYEQYDPEIRHLLQSASCCFSISDAMTNTFSARYGVNFTPMANAVHPSDYPPNENLNRAVSKVRPRVVRYVGSLAPDMCYQSILDFARVVSDLQDRIALKFEIYTRPPWFRRVLKDTKRFKGTEIRHQVNLTDYRELLRSADLLLIAYNFDERSVSYVQYSMANKMPEYLASGVPVLAYGPLEVATVAYLSDNACAEVVTRCDEQVLRKAVLSLLTDADRRGELTRAARRFIFHRHNAEWLVRRFRGHMAHAAFSHVADNNLAFHGDRILAELEMSFARDAHVHIDETRVLADLLEHRPLDSVMIDVGAHHGSALLPFLDMGWRVYAFEPDSQNRAALLKRIDKHAKKHLVHVDPRAVSKSAANEVPFYRSDVSTGISALSAFHESHERDGVVSTTTLTESLGDADLTEVAFLKVDTEGHDLLVLQGFPWDRLRPAVIECEFEDSKTVPLGYSVHDLGGFLLERGYRVYVSEWHPVIRYGVRHDWNRLVRYPCALSSASSWGNLLAFREELDERTLAFALRRHLKTADGELALPPITADGVRPNPAREFLNSDRLTVELLRRLRGMKRTRLLFVLGNGPSLRNFDFLRLVDFDTIGMNAAYRHWRRIDWYPTYYCCLDTIVVESHHAAIRELHDERGRNGIRLFLLQRNILKHHPDLAKSPAVVIFDEWKDSVVFKGHKRITTGSMATLFGIALGYRQIFLLGVDSRYVERIAEAKPVAGDILEIVNQPSHNPNYFCDDYQRVGDRYHVPNSIPDLHVSSWVECARMASQCRVEVFNGNLDSNVKVFPFRSAEPVIRAGPACPRPPPPAATKAPRQAFIDMGGSISGTSWSDIVKMGDEGFRWLRPGTRATLSVTVDRHNELIVVVSSPRSLSERDSQAIVIEADGQRLDLRLHRETEPHVIAAKLPAAPGVNPGAPSELSFALTGPRGKDPISRRGSGIAIDRICLIRPIGNDANAFPLSHFDGTAYLARNPDVARTVTEGRMGSGLRHYCKFGRKEGRVLPLILQGRPSAGTALELSLLDVSNRLDNQFHEHQLTLAQELKRSVDDVDRRLAERVDSLAKASRQAFVEESKKAVSELVALKREIMVIVRRAERNQSRDLPDSPTNVQMETIVDEITKLRYEIEETRHELKSALKEIARLRQSSDRA